MLRIAHVGAAVTLSLGFAAAASAQQSVAWLPEPNVSVRGGMVQKTRGCEGCDDASATSRQQIRSNGSVEFRVDDPYTFWTAGLIRPGERPGFETIDFAWRFNGNGIADVIEDGAYRANSDTEANTGDSFQIAVVNNRVQYLKNGRVIVESQRRANYSLAFAVALGSVGSRLAEVRIDTSGRDFVGTSGRSRSPNNDYGSYERSFDDLDLNRNGSINRAEFNGTAQEFASLDINRDGRLSRSEWARSDTYGSGDPRYRSSPSFDPRYDRGDYETYVDARQRWTDTGVWAEAGDLVTFSAAGSVNLNQSGAVSGPGGSQYSTQNPPLRSGAVGLLIARVGNSQIIPIGEQRTVRAPVSGQVYLAVNDDILDDNSGEYRVRISVEPR